MKRILQLAMAIAISFEATAVSAFKFVETDANGVKHIRAPFVHVDVKHHKDGSKDVSVRAPFTHVENPAGAKNAYVKAPFTRVTHPAPVHNGTTVRSQPTRSADTNVKAPFTSVTEHGDHVSVKAPFTKVNKPAGADKASVKAPFVHVNPKTTPSK